MSGADSGLCPIFTRISAEPVFQVPIALFEIMALADEIDHPKAKQIVSLIDDTINVTLADSDALVKLSNAAQNGYEIRFSRTENAD